MVVFGGRGHKKGLLAIWKRIFAKIAEVEKWRTLGFCKINLMQWHPHSPTSSLYPCDCITVTKMEVNDICNPLIFYLGEATRGLLWSADPPVPRDAESGKLNLEINYPLIHPLRKQLNHQYIRLNCLKMCYIHIWITLDQNNCCAGASLPSSTEAFKESHTHILFPEADQCIAMLNFEKFPELLFYLNFLQEYLEFPSR